MEVLSFLGVGGVELGVEGWLHFCLAVLFTLGGAALLRSPLALAVLFTPGGFGFASLAFGAGCSFHCGGLRLCCARLWRWLFFSLRGASALLRSPLALAVLCPPGGFGLASLAFGAGCSFHSGGLRLCFARLWRSGGKSWPRLRSAFGKPLVSRIAGFALAKYNLANFPASRKFVILYFGTAHCLRVHYNT
ncbi:hypothetical protein D3Z45_05045 [Lachnospiraceae bacterium]|nr:hypothetical protein [Lachnospiraceae bacterium]